MVEFPSRLGYIDDRHILRIPRDSRIVLRLGIERKKHCSSFRSVEEEVNRYSEDRADKQFQTEECHGARILINGRQE